MCCTGCTYKVYMTSPEDLHSGLLWMGYVNSGFLGVGHDNRGLLGVGHINIGGCGTHQQRPCNIHKKICDVIQQLIKVVFFCVSPLRFRTFICCQFGELIRGRTAGRKLFDPNLYSILVPFSDLKPFIIHRN